jgi:hypothetical protein
MQPPSVLKRIQTFLKAFQTKYAISKTFIILSIFLLVVLLFSFIIPLVHYGQYFGTDDYTHLFHTSVMASSDGLSIFYEKMGTYVSNPGSGENDYNYPFGLWLIGATISKITGIPPVSAEFLFVIFFLCILLGAFYFYSSIFLESKEQKILAILFLLSMPSAAIDLLSYRPSVFTLPFLFILLYIVLREPVNWKLFPIALLSIFVISISHTGTFIFLIIFSILFFLLYNLFWGKFSLPMFMVILSTFIIYIVSLSWFPLIANQYDLKSTLFLTPGNFLAEKFNFSLPSELANIFYQNMLVNQEFIYALIFGALIFTLGILFQYINRKVSDKYSQLKQVYPITLPISNISHSFTAAPIWIGPMHVILSLLGYFHINSKGKCMLITALLVTILPDMLSRAQGTSGATGVTREISFSVIIIPITAVLGLWVILSYLDSIKLDRKNLISLMVWVLILLAVIITPTLATTYYLPKISGEGYIVNGMKWLGETGNLHEKVVGYGYRMVPIYTNMTDASYGIQSGEEQSTFVKLLRGAYFSSAENYIGEFQQRFGGKYILASDKLVANLQGTGDNLKIDDDKALDKIFSSKDFGIYEVTLTPDQTSVKQSLNFTAENISFKQTGYSIRIETDAYNAVLNAKYPVMEQFGRPNENYLGVGFINDNLQISGFRYQNYIDPFSPPDPSAIVRNSTVDYFSLTDVLASPEIHDNQIIYRTILKDQQNGDYEASLLVRYTFYPKTIKREFLISNDWVNTSVARYMQPMKVRFATNMFVPLNDFVIINNENRITRHMYPTQDSVELNEITPELYIHDGDRGIYFKNELTSGYPYELIYGGSTLYSMSGLSFAQSEFLKPGATFHITQFLSPGDEFTAKNNIMSQEGISLLNYPEGTIPIILTGHSDNSNASDQGSLILQNEGIPYTDFMTLQQATNSPAELQNQTGSNELLLTPDSIIQASSKINFESSAKTSRVIGSTSTSGAIFFNDADIQEHSISSLNDFAKNNGKTLIGFMPNSLVYNLDTVKILSDNNIPFMLSKTVNPPYYGYFGIEHKDPQIATYHGKVENLILFPISSPTSDALSSGGNNAEIFSAWNAIINEAAAHDEMTLFIIKTADIGNPQYTEDFKTLITNAKNKGLTFTTPDVIETYFINTQNIQYSGSINGDTATINLTNNNENMVQGVTFKVSLPVLKTGSYTVDKGTIVKTKTENNRIIVYISTNIAEHDTQEITIEPSTPREKIVVTLPRQPVEGQTIISIKDTAGNPLKNAEAIIDSKYYRPDSKGNINIDFKRGVHSIQIGCPGYESYTSTLNVKGRIYLIEKFFGKNTV